MSARPFNSPTSYSSLQRKRMCIQEDTVEDLHKKLKYYENIVLIYNGLLQAESENLEESMGNNSSKRASLPSVYYNPSSGVTVGSTTSSHLSQEDLLQAVTKDSVRLRAKASSRHKSPSPGSDKDSAIGAGGSEMSQSLYSENSINRDSFYSTCTAESGFDDLGCLEELRSSKLSGSLKENFSPNSLKERNLQMLYRAHRGRDTGLNALAKGGLDTLSDCSSEHSGIISNCSTRSSCCSSEGTFVKTNVDPLEQKVLGTKLNGEGSWGHVVSSSNRPGKAFSTSSSCDKNNSNPSKNSFVYDDHHQSARPSSKSSSHHLAPNHSHDKYEKFRQNHNSLSEENRQHILSLQKNQPPLPPVAGNHHFLDDNQSLGVSESTNSIALSQSMEDVTWDHRLPDERGQEELDDRGMEEGEESEDGDRDTALPAHLNQSLSDLQFRQSLMQRIQEWSSFAEEYNKSHSPTPDCSPVRFIRRSQSLDRHLGDLSAMAEADSEILPSSKPLDIEPVTEKNLETLECELHDIQGEFESITSTLHDLIEQGNCQPLPLAQTPMSSSYPIAFSTRSIRSPSSSRRAAAFESTPLTSNKLMVQSTPCGTNDLQRHTAIKKMRTKWERVSGSACSDTSSRSSRASSVEYVWDLADYSVNGTTPSTATALSRGRLMSTDLCPADASDCVLNMASPVSVLDYCHKEWRGDTATAQAMRQGYQRVVSEFNFDRLCVTRGDNYCGLRSTLFQVLVNGHRLVPSSWGIIGIMDRLHQHFDDPSIQMDSWTFANRLPGHCTDKLASICKCALSLYATIEEVCNLPNRQEREKRTISLFNTSATFDLELMEGLKVMMVLQLISLRQKMMDGEEDVPIFGHLLFARDSSETVADFIKNHLNALGDTGGLEQVEMCLLGYTLGVSIRVLQLVQSGQEDFECCFPEDMGSETPHVYLISEDGRHYKTPLP